MPSRQQPSHLCRALDVLEGEGARFTGDGGQRIIRRLSRLSNGSDQLRTIAGVLHLGMDLAARVRHAGVCYARHEQESRSAKVLR